MADYLQDTLDGKNPTRLIAAIGDIIRAKGVNEMAEKMGVSREGLYKSFSGKRIPNIETVLNALDILGLSIVIVPKPHAERKKREIDS